MGASLSLSLFLSFYLSIYLSLSSSLPLCLPSTLPLTTPPSLRLNPPLSHALSLTLFLSLSLSYLYHSIRIASLNNRFPKYLTGSRLLHLQLRDPVLRLYFLTQCQILFHYLSHDSIPTSLIPEAKLAKIPDGVVKIKNAISLSPKQLESVAELQKRSSVLIKHTPPLKGSFQKQVRLHTFLALSLSLSLSLFLYHSPSLSPSLSPLLSLFSLFLSPSLSLSLPPSHPLLSLFPPPSLLLILFVPSQPDDSLSFP